jgi:uncharacterized protein YkwD
MARPWGWTRCALAALAALALSASCGPLPSPQRAAGARADDIALTPGDDLPPSNPMYATEPTGDALLGGPSSRDAEAQLLAALRKRGDRPQGDGRLALLARWGLRQALRGTAIDPASVDAIARRVGWVGPTPWVYVFRGRRDGARPIEDSDLDKQVADIPSNVPVTRYGIATVSRGDDEGIAVAMQSLEVTLHPVQKRLAVKDELRLAGTLGDRFQRAQFAVTFPGGTVRTWESATREVTGTWVIAETGVHRIELLGDGPSGPVVVANFPIYVGVDEPAADPAGVAAAPATGDAGAREDAPGVEATMLALLNGARAEAHLPPLQPDADLAAVARGHSADMQTNGFFGHVSPSKGTTEDRLRAARLLYSLVGENVARAGSAKTAHQSLMGSPAHRGVMLGAEFTHVGVGAVVSQTSIGVADVFVTLDFAREQPVAVDDVPRHVMEATDMARLPHLIPKLRADESLAEAARQGIAVLASDPGAPPPRVLDAAKAAAFRGRAEHPTTCVLLLKSNDVKHLDPPAPTKDARAERIGVAAVRAPEGPESFAIVMIVQAGGRRGLACE